MTMMDKKMMNREKLSVREAIIVEGRYDKNTLSQIVDTLILETEGFGIFQNREYAKLLKTIAEKQGMIIFTDSDAAGFQIRNYLKSILPTQFLKHAYIPEIPGKEKRKKQPSKEGLLGVEGIDVQLLLKAILDAGATVTDGNPEPITKETEVIQRIDLYRWGLSGGTNSRALREKICTSCGIPSKINQTDLLKILNRISRKEEIAALIKKG